LFCVFDICFCFVFCFVFFVFSFFFILRKVGGGIVGQACFEDGAPLGGKFQRGVAMVGIVGVGLVYVCVSFGKEVWFDCWWGH
jgi:hypothetical protein